VGTCRRPPSSDEVALGHRQVDNEREIREGSTKVARYLRLTRAPGLRLRGAQVVPNVVIGEQFECDIGISSAPDFLVEPCDDRLVLRLHFKPPYDTTARNDAALDVLALTAHRAVGPRPRR
jgi:hypothetical protein